MQLVYNNITFPLAKTNNWHREPIFTPDRTTVLYTRHVLDVTTIYNPGALSCSAAGAIGPGYLPAITDVALRELILQHNRSQLTYSDDLGNLMLSSPPGGNTVDALDGPKVLDLSITKISGSKSMLVRIVIETHLNECGGGPSGDGAGLTSVPPILANRWSDSHSIDENQRAVIQYVGETIFDMSALQDLGRTADYYRNQCLPPVLTNFRRVSLSITVNSIGNRLSWTCVDQYMYYSLGDSGSSKFPSVLSFEGSYTEVTISGGGNPPMLSGFLSDAVGFKVMGTPTALRKDLIPFAVAMSLSKLQYAVGAFPGGNTAGAFPTHIEVVEHLHMPAIEFRMAVMRPVAQNGVQGLFGMRKDIFLDQGSAYQANNPFLTQDGKNPQLLDNNSRSPILLGQAFAAVLQAACSPISPSKGGPGAGGSGTGYAIAPNYSVTTSVSNSATLAPVSTSFSPANTAAGFSEYRVDARVDTNPHTYQQPVSGTVNGQPAACEIINLASSTSTVLFDWTCERLGAPPIVPDPNIDDKNYVLGNYTITPASFGLLADGTTKGYRCAGRYEYLLNSPINPGDPLVFAAPPMYAFAWGSDSLTNFAQGIIGSMAGASGSSGGSSTASFVGTDH